MLVVEEPGEVIEPVSEGDDVGETSSVEPAGVKVAVSDVPVSVAVTGQIVVETATVSVTTTTDELPLVSGQSVTDGGHDEKVRTVVVKKVEVDNATVVDVVVE